LRWSSAFPFAGDVLFFPCPATSLGREKSLKEVEFVSTDALGKLARGEPISPQLELIQRGTIWVSAAERESLIELCVAPLRIGDTEKDNERTRLRVEPARLELWDEGSKPAPHVMVDRFNNASNLYFAGRLTFRAGCGLYFWAECADDTQRARLEEALDYLKDAGLGGRRSYGHGQFDWTRTERTLPASANANWQMSLSLIHPKDHERTSALNGARYKMILRSGWIDSPVTRSLRRRSVWMLREGALLPTAAQVQGELCETQPQLDGRSFPHPVYRAGLAFTMPIHVEEEP
jgi:CRISPR-associated protein Csm4